MTNSDLEHICTQWQSVLRLQDWDISIAFKRSFEMGPDRGGEVAYTLSKKTAIISVLEPSDYSPAFINKQDLERTIVHELLHLHTGPFMPIENNAEVKMLEEIAIHALSGALVGLKRFYSEPTSVPEFTVITESKE